ncbi:DNA polymerase III, epsilon subunit [marine gamma proteobacterium HTCC2207]|jgi:DNA polymerase-3 subunit epsilon|uniref:Excinuclease cho n=1 Tax=gamma proteobacterium HTCC2207 TaxID=314287 RepID=Q1YU82_9GAMM|nr:DNA polymerase III, epsilon subunit [marine gamma proteobacterium HTCC2207] [gamma proteobacterium HTCC2207]MBT6115625.1 GIY-YIG nuclease family protein [Porticoccaceae bacterium]MDB4581103.1 exonuclease domain-containing protein [Porticoccaceae bacterium]MDC0589885.1 exonuclease domain-containing protein [Porticoccaceae bacterium]MDG1079958.1 exonuclease domain-containing protein [Porticoccaceae bacterium]
MQLNWLDDETPTPETLSGGFPEKMVLLDLETTGGKATHHRIIEIGLLVIEQGKVLERWQSFVDPETVLPPFIQKLTGIAPSMLRGAPLFSEVAETLLTYLNDRTLVAHNARFDYGFLKNEFQRIGISYNAKPLCSVKFSRSLYPQFKRHGLDQIIKRFQLPIENRHRALDDAEMIQRFFLKSSALFSDEEIGATCASLLKNPALPPLLKASDIKKLPASAGVYYFYDANGALLYVGKSIHIRNRVMSHFSQDHSNPKDLQINNKLAHIDFEKTPSDLGAQIRESNQIKALYPLYNRRLRKTKKLYQYRCDEDRNGYQRIAIEAVELDSDSADERFGLFRSPRQASKQIEKLADHYFLCHKLLGLESSTATTSVATNQKPCFRAQLKKCFGACHGAESPENYNERVSAALKTYQLKMWPYPGPILIEERDMQEPEHVAFHVVHNWRYIAKLTLIEDLYDHGYQLADARQSIGAGMSADLTAGPNESDQRSATPSDDRFDLDIYFILVRFLVDAEKMKMNNLKVWPLTAC